MIRSFSFISNKSLALLFFMSSLLFVACKTDEEKCKEGDWEACGREIVNVAMENFQRGLDKTVKTKKDGKFTFGMFEENSHNLVEIKSCLIAKNEINNS